MDEISDLITTPGQPALTTLGENEPRLPADLDDHSGISTANSVS